MRWTDRHSAVAAALLVSLGGMIAAVTDTTGVPAVMAVAVLVTAVAGLTLDAWGGLVAGLLVSAAVIGLRRLTGSWDVEVFVPALVETACLLMTGAAAGAAGTRLRLHRPAPPVEEDTWARLGILDRDNGLLRLEEEVAERSRHGGALDLALVQVQPRPGAGEAEMAAAMTSVARIIGTRTGDLDLPFVLRPGTFGVIFPHATDAVVWATLGTIAETIRTAPLSLRAEHIGIRVGDVASVEFGVSHQKSRWLEATECLAEAEEQLRVAREGSSG